MLTIRRLIVISRPIFYMPVLIVYVVGVLHGGSMWSWETLLAAAFLTLPMGLIVYGINDIADRESDARNPRKGGGEGAVLLQSETATLSRIIIGMMALGVVLAAILGSIGFLLAILVIYVLSYLYSVKPVRLKSRPGLDSLANGAWISAIFLAGFWTLDASAGLAMPPLRLTLALFLFAATFHALSTVMDYSVDKANGDRTISTVLGRRRTLLICAAAFLICFVWEGVNYPILGSYLIISAAACVIGSYYDSEKLSRQLFLFILVTLPVAVAVNILVILA